MKNNVFVCMFLIILVSISLYSCDLAGINDYEDSDVDNCPYTERDLINRDFYPNISVHYPNGEAFVGSVKLEIYKKYCNGKIKGHFYKDGTTDDEGDWDSNYRYTYKYENTYDCVIIYIGIYNDNNIKIFSDARYYYYDDVVKKNDGLFDTIYVTID